MQNLIFIFVCIVSVVVYTEQVKLGEVGYCKPSERFRDDCNWCTCNREGTGAACTLAACPGKQHNELRRMRSVTECNSGDTKMADCNSCHCIKNHWACTRMACPGLLTGNFQPTPKA